MALSDELYTAAKPVWDAQLAHPFVRGIADGSLPVDRFARWVCQDYLYLTEYARLFAWAVAKAQGLEAMGWYAKVLDLTLNTEMALHRAYAARFGISSEELEAQAMWPTTRAYTDFLIRTAADGDMLDVLAALLPCAWGYVYVAQHLARGPRPDDQRYADWIEQYVSEEFVQAAEWLKAELNRLGEGAIPMKRRRLCDIFLLSSRYELLFWEMCWKGESWPSGE
ncbi:MAG TPA: thiaminase II [Candidatus Sulfotelmatobacter sp.]|nr:thiaminase II [Candidatus Sulfotelmatobacter sp.]